MFRDQTFLMRKAIGSVPLLIASILTAAAAAPPPPMVGSKAPDFSLSSVSGKTVRLSDLQGSGPVVLVVLRGFPGYQCPLCNRQVQEFIQKSSSFAERGARIVMVYPGPPQDLNAKAAEFLANKTLPDSFDLLLDPGYEFTNLYGLRWTAPKETAYPSTFLIDAQGVVFFSKSAKSHAGRTTSAEILDLLPKPKTTP